MASENAVNTGIVNNYTIRPKNLTQYNAFRGVIDFSQPGQFDQFETGYSFLAVLKMPKFMEMLAEKDSGMKDIVQSFNHMLEYEFRGLSGLPDMTGDGYEVGDGVNTVRFLSNVSRDTSVELSSTFYERRGSLITKYMAEYLSGIKDPMSKAKTYHGLIAKGFLEPSLENEVGTFMYMVTDNTMLRLEKAYLLCDVQFTKAEESMYDSTKGDINNREMNISFNCFPVTGYMVDKAAKSLLEDITGVQVNPSNNAGGVTYSTVKTEDVAVLDSANYRWGIMDERSASHLENLVKAANTDNGGTTSNASTATAGSATSYRGVGTLV